MLNLALGGAALARCDYGIVATAALAAEVALSMRHLAPQQSDRRG